jgi:hypothetical protein
MEEGGRVAESVQGVKSLRVPEEWVVDVEQVGIQGGLVELMTKVDVVCSSTVTNARDWDADSAIDVSGVGSFRGGGWSVFSE